MSKLMRNTILVLSLAAALSYDWLFPKFIAGFNYILFVFFLVIAGIMLQLIINKKLYNSWSLLFAVPVLWFAVCCFLYNNSYVHLLAPIATWLLLFLFYFWSGDIKLSLKKIKSFLPISLLTFFGGFFGSMHESFKGLFKVNYKIVGKIIIALVLVLPLMILFVGLFAGADLVYRDWLRDFFSFDFNLLLVWRIIRTIFLILFFGGVFFAYLNKKRLTESEIIEDKQKDSEHSDNLIPNVIMGILNVLFISFISLQVMFLFGGHEIIKQHDISYSAYAHNGFNQMAWIAIFVLILAYIMYRIDQPKKINFLKISTALIVAQTIVICVSALKRMFLYINAYGFTQLRFWVASFIIYLAVILLVLAVIVLWRAHYRNFIKITLATTVLSLMILCGVNSQGYIAKVNIDRYLAGQGTELDIDYLTQLTSDIYPQLQRLNDDVDPKIRQSINHWREREMKRLLGKVEFENPNSDAIFYSYDVSYDAQNKYQFTQFNQSLKNDSGSITTPLIGIKYGKFWKILTLSDLNFLRNELK
jgi:hypothetical protein